MENSVTDQQTGRGVEGWRRGRWQNLCWWCCRTWAQGGLTRCTLSSSPLPELSQQYNYHNKAQIYHIDKSTPIWTHTWNTHLTHYHPVCCKHCHTKHNAIISIKHSCISAHISIHRYMCFIRSSLLPKLSHWACYWYHCNTHTHTHTHTLTQRHTHTNTHIHAHAFTHTHTTITWGQLSLYWIPLNLLWKTLAQHNTQKRQNSITGQEDEINTKLSVISSKLSKLYISSNATTKSC